MRRQRRVDGSGRADERLGEVAHGVAHGGDNLSGHVLNLQRDYGNAAVTTVVQRRERPQSTDAPGVKKKPKPKKEVSFAPTEPGEATEGRTAPWLINQGNQYFETWKSSKTAEGKKLAEARATAYYLGAMWIAPSPMNAQYLTKFYKTVGGDKDPRYLYWMQVQNRAITLTPHKAGEEDMSDKGH